MGLSDEHRALLDGVLPGLLRDLDKTGVGYVSYACVTQLFNAAREQGRTPPVQPGEPLTVSQDYRADECPKPGEIRVIGGRRMRFIERELEGDKWEPVGPVQPAVDGDRREAELYRHMRDVAEANGFESLTQAITEARKARALIADDPAAPRSGGDDALLDPVAVHVNMLRGGIAKLTPEAIGHLYRGTDAVRVVDEVRRQNPDAFAQPVQARGGEREVIQRLLDRLTPTPRNTTVRDMVKIHMTEAAALEHVADLQWLLAALPVQGAGE